MAVRIQRISAFVLLALLSASFRLIASQADATRSSPTTQIVLLGTGTPGWDPDSSGPATAIVVNGTPYLVDFGPGVVRRAGAASLPAGRRPRAVGGEPCDVAREARARGQHVADDLASSLWRRP